MCYAREGDPRIPELVSVSLARCRNIANLLRIMYHADDEKPIYNITSCLGPIFNFYNQRNWLVESVELDHMLGVDLSVFPIYSISPELDLYMENFQDEGMIKVFPWYLPLLKQMEYYGQRLLLNDCLYRYMYKSKYIIIKDLDEIIVPSRNAHNLVDMLESLPMEGVAEYNIRSVIYRDDLFSNYTGGANRTLLDLYQPKTLLNAKKESHIYRHLLRSKYIILPKRVLEVNVHSSKKYISPYDRYDVPIDLALVHHHRLPVVKAKNRETEDDTEMERYANEILNRIHQRHIKVSSMVEGHRASALNSQD